MVPAVLNHGELLLRVVGVVHQNDDDDDDDDDGTLPRNLNLCQYQATLRP